MAPFMYNGQRVQISPFSDIPYEMRSNGRYATLVQTVLDQTEPWAASESPIEGRYFSIPVRPVSVEVPAGVSRVWGVHRGHKARTPGLSPFVDIHVDERLMGYVTIELGGSPDKPLLIRAYGGEYTPPLPWMMSAKDADGGREACLRYWQSHAYLSRTLRMIKEGTSTTEAPDWFDSSISS
jgi:hypothetical protein